MPVREPRHRRLAAVAATIAVLVGCGTADEPSIEPPIESPSPPGGDDDASGDTAMSVYSVSEALAVDESGSLHVVGLLIDDGSGWRLCEMVLESYPPQCGGDRLAVEELDPSILQLEEEGDVQWQDGATLVGEIDGDTLTVTGSAASS